MYVICDSGESLFPLLEQQVLVCDDHLQTACVMLSLEDSCVRAHFLGQTLLSSVTQWLVTATA